MTSTHLLPGWAGCWVRVAPIGWRFYDLLFDSASKTLLEIAADPKHLGARIGVLAVLHTWSQTLELHPHLHCIVPGGGVSLDGQRWVSSRPNYFLPVQVLARLFRGKFLAAVKAAFQAGQLRLPEALQDPAGFQALIDRLYAKTWVVYSKPPFGNPSRCSPIWRATPIVWRSPILVWSASRTVG